MGSSGYEAKQNEKFAASLRAAENLLMKLGSKVEQLDRYTSEGLNNDDYITGLRFKVLDGESEEIMGIVKLDGVSGKQIGFHFAPTLVEAISGLASRINNGTMKYKEDKPYEDR